MTYATDTEQTYMLHFTSSKDWFIIIIILIIKRRGFSKSLNIVGIGK